MMVLVFQDRTFKGKKCVFGRKSWGCFTHVEFEVLVGYSDGEVQIGAGGATPMWPGPCGPGELWVERSVSASV